MYTVHANEILIPSLNVVFRDFPVNFPNSIPNFNLYKLNAVVKWNGCYSKMFDITHGTRQGSKLSPYLFNIFINQLLLDLNDCDVGVRIGDVLYNSMAYADDITVFSTNAKDLQRLIDMCTMYSDRWRFKYGIDKSKCMIIGKSPFTCEPVWRLNDVSLRNVDTIEILGNVFNSKGNNTSHVDNRLNKCRQSFYSLNSLGRVTWGKAPPRGKAPLPSNYEFTYASGSIS